MSERHHLASSGILLLLALGAVLPAQEEPTGLFLTGAPILTGPEWKERPASLHIAEGRIVAVLPADAPAPAGTRTISLSGVRIAPAFVDAGSSALLDSEDEATDASQAMADRLKAFDLDTLLRLRTAGLGLVGCDAPVSDRSQKGGTVALALPVADGAYPELLEAAFGVTFAAPAGARVGGGNPRFRTASRPLRRDANTHRAVVGTIEAAFRAAEAHRKKLEKFDEDLEKYQKALEAWEKGEKSEKPKEEAKPEAEPAPTERRRRPRFPEGFREWPREKQQEWMRARMEEARNRSRGGGDEESKTGESKKGDRPVRPVAPLANPEADRLLAVLDGKAPLRVHADFRETIAALVTLAEEKDLRLVILGGGEAHLESEGLKRVGATVVLGAPQRTPRPGPFDEAILRADQAARLEKAGVPIAFMTSGVAGFGATDAPLLAALAMGQGLSEEGALNALTTGGAKALGLDDLGRIAPGQRAHLQLLDGRPLAPETKVRGLILGERHIAGGAR